jgi:hypothetical protein
LGSRWPDLKQQDRADVEILVKGIRGALAGALVRAMTDGAARPRYAAR